MQYDLFCENTITYMKEILSWNDPLTPVEQINGRYYKREDKFKIFDVCGAKSRQAYYLISNAKENTIITCGSRVSPQIQIVANICKHLNKKCICFTNRGSLTNELLSAKQDGATIMQNEKWIYNNVVIYHAKKYCMEHHDTKYIPFGMESWEAIRQTAYQVKNIPNNIKSIVVVAGSGLNLCGILWGCYIFNRNIKIKAIRVGKDIKDLLNKYAPMDTTNLTIVDSPVDYHTKVKDNTIDGIELDPIYEGKCIPFLTDTDMLWIIGKRREVDYEKY